MEYVIFVASVIGLIFYVWTISKITQKGKNNDK